MTLFKINETKHGVNIVFINTKTEQILYFLSIYISVVASVSAHIEMEQSLAPECLLWIQKHISVMKILRDLNNS